MKHLRWVLPILLAAVVTACAAPEAPAREGGMPTEAISFTDACGREVVLPKKPERVVSCSGSFAEVWVLSGGALAGTTEDAVSERGMALEEGTAIVGTIKKPNVEEILAVEPDFVILSADIEGHIEAGQALDDANITHAYFHIEEFTEYLDMLKLFTDLTGRADLYEENGLKVRARIDEIKASCADRPSPTVLFARAYSTGVRAKGADNMTGIMLEELGADNIVSRHESLLEELGMEAIIEEDPDFILITTMGDEQKALEALENGIMANPAWSGLTAVKEERVEVLPKELFHYKPNARWADAYAYLAQLLYPGTAE